METNRQALEDSLTASNRIQALMNCQASREMMLVQAQLNQETYAGPDTIIYPDGSRVYVDRASRSCFATL